jgi:hypothetical protein
MVLRVSGLLFTTFAAGIITTLLPIASSSLYELHFRTDRYFDMLICFGCCILSISCTNETVLDNHLLVFGLGGAYALRVFFFFGKQSVCSCIEMGWFLLLMLL